MAVLLTWTLCPPEPALGSRRRSKICLGSLAPLSFIHAFIHHLVIPYLPRIYSVPGTGGIRDQTHNRSCSWEVQSGGKETGGGGVGWRESPELKSGGRVLDLGSSSPFLVTVGQVGVRIGVLSYLGGFSRLQTQPRLS